MRKILALSSLALIAAAPPPSPDARLRSIIQPVSQAQLRHTIEALVSFGTRHTLSSQTDPKRGIGAALSWAEAEFNRLFGANKDKDAVPDDIPEVSVGPGPHRLAPVIVKACLAKSNSEANQKIKEGAVSLDGQKVTEFQREYGFDKPVVLKLGRKFARVRP